MEFDHEKLDVYRVALEFSSWAYRPCKLLQGMDRNARERLLRASQSIALNIAEGNGKRSMPDRRRFFEIARGSALECAAILDTLVVCEVLGREDANRGKAMLVRAVAMLTKLTAAGDRIRETTARYAGLEYEYEYEYDDEHDHDDEHERRFAEHEHGE
jgi:four helix bundle protein